MLVPEAEIIHQEEKYARSKKILQDIRPRLSFRNYPETFGILLTLWRCTQEISFEVVFGDRLNATFQLCTLSMHRPKSFEGNWDA